MKKNKNIYQNIIVPKSIAIGKPLVMTVQTAPDTQHLVELECIEHYSIGVDKKIFIYTDTEVYIGDLIWQK